MSARDADDGAADDGDTEEPEVPLLATAYDNPEDPTEVTLFPAHLEDPRTCWISAAVDTAVSLDAAA